ncbi:TetR family transcriptional regulator [bacterium]|nr:TetR family transcriptional regulator [bacterium]
MSQQDTYKRQEKISLESENRYSIGKLTRAVTQITGIHCTSAMIYNYENKGLLEDRERTETGFRLFREEDLKRVICIKKLQEEGKSLQEIKGLLNDCPESFLQIDELPELLQSTKKSIVLSARESFLSKGYEAATLADIAQNAGVSVTTIYQHFNSKADLFKALISDFSFQDVLEEIIEDLGDKQLRTKEDIRSLLIQLAKVYIKMHEENEEVFRLVLNETRKFPEIGKKYNQQLVKPLTNLTEKLITYAIEQGLFNPIDSGVASHAFYGLFFIFHLTQDLLEGEGILHFPKKNRTETLVDIYLNGMLIDK